jgi:hypothetical protein
VFGWGKEAMENLVSGKDDYIEDIASNELRFGGYFDDSGNVTNFYPIISQ